MKSRFREIDRNNHNEDDSTPRDDEERISRPEWDDNLNEPGESESENERWNRLADEEEDAGIFDNDTGEDDDDYDMYGINEVSEEDMKKNMEGMDLPMDSNED